jgi:hypothetical protein
MKGSVIEDLFIGDIFGETAKGLKNNAGQIKTNCSDSS